MSVTPLPPSRESGKADNSRRSSLSRPPPAAPEFKSASAFPAYEAEMKAPDPEFLPFSPPLVEMGVVVVLEEELDGLLLALGHEARPPAKAAEGYSSLYYEVEYNGHMIVIARPPDQGQHHVRNATCYLIEVWRVPNVVLLGVSGGLSNDLRVGDVVVASNVHDLAHHGAMVDSPEGGSVHKLGGRNFECDRLFVERAGMFSELHRSRFGQWQADCKAMFDRVVPESFYTARDDFNPKEVFRPDGSILWVGTIASGSDVGKSHKYKKEILSHDRNMKALDCESAGFMHQLELSSQRFHTKGLILRAISDQATSHKEKLKAMKAKDPLFCEPKSRDPLQKLAAYNAGRLLLALLDEYCVHCQLDRMVRELKHRKKLMDDAVEAHTLHLKQMREYFELAKKSLDEPARSHFYVCMPGKDSLCVVYNDKRHVRVQLKNHADIQSTPFDCRPTRVACCQGSDGKVRLVLATGRPQQETGSASTSSTASNSPAVSRPSTPGAASSGVGRK